MNFRRIMGQPRFLRYGLAYGLTFGFLALTLLVYFVFGIPIDYISRDMAAILEVNPLLGFQSNLGILLWVTAAAICLFSAKLSSGRQRHFLSWAGLLSLGLGLDDLFMFHEELYLNFGDYLTGLFPGLVALPLFTETTLYAVYGLAFTLFAWVYRPELERFDRNWLLIALGFFALSLFIDIFARWLQLPGSLFFEDGTKLLGIVGWTTYFCSAAYIIVAARLQPETS